MIYSETFGAGPDVLFLHGLFGSGDNWRGIGRALADRFRIHLLDLPNHGRSPWLDNPELPTLAAAVDEWASGHGLQRYRLLGHSMGGKVAMQMALNRQAANIERMIIVDIAPKQYASRHQDIFAGLKSINLDRVSDRKAADKELEPYVGDASIRQFLLKSLATKDGRLYWRFNLEILEKRYDAIGKAPAVTAPFRQPTLFIKGQNSDYMVVEDREPIKKLFPNASSKLIDGAGHWPHAEKPSIFTKIVGDFLSQ